MLPKQLIRYAIYGAILIFFLYVGFDFITKSDVKTPEEFEIQVELTDSTNMKLQ